jgi:hypothetical protein
MSVNKYSNNIENYVQARETYAAVHCIVNILMTVLYIM